MAEESSLAMNKEDFRQVEASRNWPGLIAAGALLVVGWMLVHSYSELNATAELSAVEAETLESANRQTVTSSTSNQANWAYR